MRILTSFFSLLFFVAFFSGANAKPAELKQSELSLHFEELMEQHATTKTLSPEVIKRLLNNFLTELDPTKSYFLEEEVHPWIDPDDKKAALIEKELLRNDISEFQTIHALFLKAISRHRAIELEININDLPKGVSAKEFKDLSWVKTREELKNRIARIRALQMEGASKLDPELKNTALQRIQKRQAKFEEEAESEDPQNRERFILTRLLKAFASSLDAHTVYFTPDEAKQFLINVEQRLFGIGAQLRDDLNGFTITKIVEGGPAALSGLVKVGDRIIAVNREPVVGMDIVDGVELIRGQESTPVTLKLIRKGDEGDQELEVTLMRGEVVLKESRYDVREDPYGSGFIGYLRLHSFYQDPEFSSAKDLAAAIEKMKGKGSLLGIVLDLRYNSGGLLTQAVDVSGLFLDKGIVVSIKDEAGNIQHLRNLESNKAWSGPLVVLINRASASAAEIVAKSLQDWGRALIIGDDHSFGKGTFQTFSLAPGASAVNPKGEKKVTRGMYYTTSGKSPQLEGVHADIMVPGLLSESDIGEKFAKYPLVPNEISPGFIDDLADIPFFQRAEARQLLSQLPLQKREEIYAQILPKLKKNSEERILQNKPYQKFLASLKKGGEEEEEIDEGDEVDFQLDETLNIMKDILFLKK